MGTEQIQALHKSLIQRTQELKDLIRQKIETLPENPNVHFVTDNCFIVKSSMLERGGCLSAEYYNFRNQYQKIITIIEKTKIEALDACIKHIASDTRFHEVVRKNITEIWKG